MSEDWVTYFRDYHEKLEAAKLAKEGRVEEPITREPAELPEKLSLSPRQIVKAIEGLEWEPRMYAFIEHRPATFYVGETEGHNAGDIKTEAKDLVGICIGARHPDQRLRIGFVAEWLDGKFDRATVADPMGLPVELYFDYTPSANSLRRVKDEPEWAWKERMQRAEMATARRNDEYNTGESVLVHRALIKKATELKEWLAELGELLTTEGEAA